MYEPRHFQQHDLAALRALMQAHPFATLVSLGERGPTADHLPLLYDADDGRHGTLVGHVARASPLWRQAAGQPVLAVFGADHAYVSPSWYPAKVLTHKVVPTWNYAVVHAHGTLQAVEDTAWLRALVARLSAVHEAALPQPWSVDDAPEDFVQQMLRAIVGIRIPLQQLTGKWKLGQNRPEADRLAVAAQLQQGNERQRAVACMMRDSVQPETR